MCVARDSAADSLARKQLGDFHGMAPFGVITECNSPDFNGVDGILGFGLPKPGYEGRTLPTPILFALTEKGIADSNAQVRAPEPARPCPGQACLPAPPPRPAHVPAAGDRPRRWRRARRSCSASSPSSRRTTRRRCSLAGTTPRRATTRWTTRRRCPRLTSSSASPPSSSATRAPRATRSSSSSTSASPPRPAPLHAPAAAPTARAGAPRRG